MVTRLRNLTGQKFGKLTVLRRVGGTNSKKTYWECRCDCGHITVVDTGNLHSGHTKSCGHCQWIVEENGYLRYFDKNGRSFIFDKEDLEKVKTHRWSVDRKYGYVTSGKSLKLHRYLMNAPSGLVIDHVNGDPSDNRKCNLRITSQTKNTYNERLKKNSTTGYKGVGIDKRNGRYFAHIHPHRSMKFLGYYNTPKEAAAAYDKAAVFYFGEFARTNAMIQEEVKNEQVLEVG